MLTYRPILDLPEYKLKVVKVVNICEMHGTVGREVVVFDQFQRKVEIVRKLMKSAITLSFFNITFAQWGGGCNNPALSLYLILEPRRKVQSEEFFMNRCPKVEHTANVN